MIVTSWPVRNNLFHVKWTGLMGKILSWQIYYCTWSYRFHFKLSSLFVSWMLQFSISILLHTYIAFIYVCFLYIILFVRNATRHSAAVEIVLLYYVFYPNKTYILLGVIHKTMTDFIVRREWKWSLNHGKKHFIASESTFNVASFEIAQFTLLLLFFVRRNTL